MITISINIWGFGETPKLSSLKGIIQVHKPSLILFQETMVCRHKTWEEMLSMCPAWHVVATDAIGLAGGVGVMWDPKIIEMPAFLSCAGIIMIVHVMGNCQRV